MSQFETNDYAIVAALKSMPSSRGFFSLSIGVWGVPRQHYKKRLDKSAILGERVGVVNLRVTKRLRPYMRQLLRSSPEIIAGIPRDHHHHHHHHPNQEVWVVTSQPPRLI